MKCNKCRKKIQKSKSGLCKKCWDEYRSKNSKTFKVCEGCGKKISTKYNSGKLCRKCKEEKIHNYFYCKNCGKRVGHKNKYNLCYDCYKISELPHIIGKNNWAKAEMWRSKRSYNEVYFASLCKKHFKNVLENEAIFNGWDSDIILEDFKLAIEWNGVWHYQELFPGYKLDEKVNRDKIKAKEIKDSGYSLYVIKDFGKYDKKFVEKQFEIFLKYIVDNFGEVEKIGIINQENLLEDL